MIANILCFHRFLRFRFLNSCRMCGCACKPQNAPQSQHGLQTCKDAEDTTRENGKLNGSDIDAGTPNGGPTGGPNGTEITGGKRNGSEHGRLRTSRKQNGNRNGRLNMPCCPSEHHDDTLADPTEDPRAARNDPCFGQSRRWPVSGKRFGTLLAMDPKEQFNRPTLHMRN